MEIIGKSKVVQHIRTQAKKLSTMRKGIVLIGERGVGKGVVAEYIHFSSADTKKPFINLNLSCLDEDRARKLITGIIERREFRNPIAPTYGDFQMPDGTTLVFEESEKTTRRIQQALCELLEASESGKFHFRLIFPFVARIEELRSLHMIPERLYDEVSRFQRILLPPLRDRPEDIPAFVEHFANIATREMGVDYPDIDADIFAALARHDWPGNIQEVRECVERSVTFAEGKLQFRLPEDLVSEEIEIRRVLEKIGSGVEFSLDGSMQVIEKRILERVLGKFNFNQSRAARSLKITEDTLRYRMKKLGILTSRGR